jgi:hypothetical protein
MGQAASAMGLPGARGFSAGLNAGASVEAHKQIKQGIADASDARAGRSLSEPWDSTEFSPGKAVEAAGAGLRGELGEMGEKGVLGARHLSMEDATSRLTAAKGTVGNAMAVGERHKVDMLAGMRQVGVPGRNAQEAGVSYSRAAIKQVAFGDPSPFRPAPYTLLPKQITARDMDTAIQIVAHTRPIGAEGIPSVELLDNLVQTSFQRRIQLNEDPRDTIGDAAKAAGLEQWMRGSAQRLPDKGLAAGLLERLGL